MEHFGDRTPPLELWGGVECTRVRVRDDYFDQLVWSGHSRRLDDLDRIAALGVRTVRYPVLWESACPTKPEHSDWSWADERLGRLHSLGIRPIVGLVHHGSGPCYTNLLDPEFATGLARFAGSFAERFPWVSDYTPVNEPLTTARFSGLYGHWYPHARESLAFARAVINQCRATVLSMRAVRSVCPGARLVQTEDLGKTYSTPGVAYQADFDNERRWLTFDLLSGRVDRHHALGSFFLWLGIPGDELFWFREHPCPPDVLGLNYYLTSERFLDEDVDRYPAECRGGNGRHAYADVAAVRVRAEGLTGPQNLIREAWERYHLPLAITEAHLGCSREEQIRWLWEVWQAARSARGSGIDIRAVTAWSLFGTYDWDSLMTRVQGHYEPGAFDVRGPTPRPTAIATLVRDLATGRTPDHPVLAQPGWWHRPERLTGVAPTPLPAGNQPLVIVGATGTLGCAFARICTLRGLPFRLLGRAELDIAELDQVENALDRYHPWAVVNAAGYVRVDDAERDPHRCFRENVVGATALATACGPARIPLVTFSSDLVFDGRQRVPYLEGDLVGPLGVYGRTKAEAERRVLALHPAALIVRTSAFFGPWDEYNFVSIGLKTISADRPFRAANDAVVSPTYVPDLVHACLDLLLDGERGIWHISNQGETTWAAFAQRAAMLADLDPEWVQPFPTKSLGLTAARPDYSALGSERGLLLPLLEDALGRYCRERLHGHRPKAREFAEDDGSERTIAADVCD